MPFTPTHILAILPIAAVCRGSLPFSALVIGSMIPDLPLFLPAGPDYSNTHSPAGIFIACLPVGLLAFFTFQLAMKRSLYALLPAAIQERRVIQAEGRVFPTMETLVRSAAAVSLGAGTHVFWDSFTHRGRWGARLLGGLEGTALRLGGQGIPTYKVLQYGSTLVGLPCLALFLAFWLYRRVPKPLDGLETLSPPWKVTGASVAAVVPSIVGGQVWSGSELPRYERLGLAVRSSGLALMILTMVYCVGFSVIARRAGGARTERADNC